MFLTIGQAKGQHQNNKSLVRPPFLLGLEFSGIIAEAPPGSRFKTGDAVFGECPGSYTEYLTVPVDCTSLHPIPFGWSFTDAAGLAGTLPVSYGALVLAGRLSPGETVLVHSAAGGLGVMAIQVAVAKGCRVFGTAGSDEKCAFVRSHGALDCFNYSSPDWLESVMQATGRKGVNLVFDPVGLVEQSVKCIARRGRILVVGFAGSGGQFEKIAMNRLLLKQVTIIGYVSASLSPLRTHHDLQSSDNLPTLQLFGETLRGVPEDNELIWRDLHSMIEAGNLKPRVYNRYEGFESVPQALRDLSERKVIGKAVVSLGSSNHIP